MVIKTREKQRQSFRHLLDNVIQLNPDVTLHKVLATHSITTISQVLIMKSDGIDSLNYLDDAGAEQNTPAHVIAVLHILKYWNYHLLHTYQMKIVDWEDEIYVNPDEYMEFCLNIFNPDIATSSIMAPPSKPISAPPSTATYKVEKTDLAHEFRKGVIGDKSHYIILKDGKD